MSAYDGVGSLVSVVIVTHVHVRSARIKIPHQLVRRSQVTETIVIVYDILKLSVTHPVRARSFDTVQVNNSALVGAYTFWQSVPHVNASEVGNT